MEHRQAQRRKILIFMLGTCQSELKSLNYIKKELVLGPTNPGGMTDLILV